MIARVRLFGVDVDVLDMAQTVERCIELLGEGRFVQQTSLNAGKVVLMRDDPWLTEVVGSSDVVSADGQSIVWAARLLGVQLPERVAGIDLMEQMLVAAEKRALPVYFLGATAEVLDRFMKVCRSRFPALVIAGFHDGYFDDDASVAGEVRASGARLLFVAMPSPRKEHFLAANANALGPLFAMGVGGSFDVWAGVTKRAPLWMQRGGLEWFYRLMQEPRRMWRRYVAGNTVFLAMALREWWWRTGKP